MLKDNIRQGTMTSGDAYLKDAGGCLLDKERSLADSCYREDPSCIIILKDGYDN